MSKRHGKITRYGKRQKYDVIVMRPTGKSVEHRETWDELPAAELKALESQRLQTEGALLLDLIMGPEEESHLYGMSKEEFFARATLLD